MTGVIFAHGVAPPAGLPEVLLHWPWHPIPLVGLVGTAVLYHRAARHGSRRRRGRVMAFDAGLVLIAAAVLSPLDTYAGVLFSVHMVQHVLLVMVAPPLLLAGVPVTVLLRAAPRPWRRRLLAVLESPVVGVLTHPVISWTALAVTMWWTHFTGIYDAALERPIVHEIEHIAFLVVGLLFWWPVVGVDPAARRRLPFGGRILYLFLAMPQNTFLALALWSSRVLRYPHYTSIARDYGPPPLDDQRLGAGIMWVAGDVTLLVSALLVMAAWARHEERGTAQASRGARTATVRLGRRSPPDASGVIGGHRRP